MDIEVHRLRIGNWKPDAIKTVSCDDRFSHNLAIGKENGEIEILDPVDNFATLLRVPGRNDFSLQALSWSKFVSENGRNRLFGVSLKGFLFEVDLNVGTIIHITDCFSSAVWALASCPRSDTLAVACEDGAIRLFEFGHHRRAPDYLKSFATSGTRVLCLAYHQTLPKLVIGSADGVLRILDEMTGRVLQRLSATTPVGQRCCIWTVAVLRDETIVTGDSNGRVLLWDGQRGIATHCFTQHSADVLALACSPDENQLFAAGVDGKVISLRRNTSSSAANAAQNSWQYTHSHRSHTHDVFCLAICATSTHQRQLPAYHRKRKRTVGDLGILGSAQSLGEAGMLGQYSGYHSGDCLVSGGMDAKLCVYAVQDFARLRPLYLPFLPHGHDVVQHDRNYQLLALRQGRDIDIWQSNLGFTQPGKGSQENVSGYNPELALRVSVRGAEHIRSMAMSPCGRILVCVTNSSNSDEQLRIWQLSRADNTVSVAGKISLPSTLSFGQVTSVQFNPFFNESKDAVAEFSVYDGSRQRLLLIHCQKTDVAESNLVSLNVIASIDCADSQSNASQPASSTVAAARTIAGAAPRRLVFSPCGKFVAFTASTKFLENHLSAVGEGETAANTVVGQSAGGSSHGASGAASVSEGSTMSVGSDSSLRIVSAHSVGVIDLVKRSVVYRLRALPSAAVDLSFITSSVESNGSPNLLVLQQNGALKCFDIVQHKSVALPCASLMGHSPANEVRLPHRLRFPLQHIAPLESFNAASENVSSKLFIYGQMQSVFVDLTLPQPETPRIVQPSYLMSAAQIAQQHLLAQSYKSQDQRQRVVQASVPIGSTDAASATEILDVDVSKDADISDSRLKKRKVQFAGGKEKDSNATTAVSVQKSVDSSNNNNCCLVDVYRNILHMGFLSIPNSPAESTNSQVKKTKRSGSDLSSTSTRQIMILVENPWARIVESLPETVARKRYGT